MDEGEHRRRMMTIIGGGRSHVATRRPAASCRGRQARRGGAPQRGSLPPNQMCARGGPCGDSLNRTPIGHRDLGRLLSDEQCISAAIVRKRSKHDLLLVGELGEPPQRVLAPEAPAGGSPSTLALRGSDPACAAAAAASSCPPPVGIRDRLAAWRALQHEIARVMRDRRGPSGTRPGSQRGHRA